MSHKYTPSAIAANNVPTAQSPGLGGNKRVYFSHSNCFLVGAFVLGADAGSAVYAANSAFTLATPFPDYLQMRVKKHLAGTGTAGQWPTATLGMTDDADQAMSRAFTIQAPSFVSDQTRNFLPGHAVDSAAPAGSEKIKTVTGAVSAQSYVPEGAELEIWQLPDRAGSWIQLGCVNSLQYPTPHPESVSIACGMNSTAFTASGMTPEKTLQLNAKFFNTAETRIWGKRGSMMVEVLKDELVVERQVFSGVYLTPSVSFPDGSEVITMDINGKYEDFFVFPAL